MSETPTVYGAMEERFEAQERALQEANETIQAQQEKIDMLDDMVQALVTCFRDLEAKMDEQRSRSSSIHEANQVPLYGTCFGYLYKQSGGGIGHKQWKKRWFVLKDEGDLCYWKTAKSSTLPSELPDKIELQNTRVYKFDDAPNTLYGFQIVGRSRKPVCLAAPSQAERDKWMKAIAEGTEVAKLNAVGTRASISGFEPNMRHELRLTCEQAMKQGSHRSWITYIKTDGSWKTLYAIVVDDKLYMYSSPRAELPDEVISIVGLRVKDASNKGRRLLELVHPDVDERPLHCFTCETVDELVSWHHALSLACAAATSSPSTSPSTSPGMQMLSSASGGGSSSSVC